MRQKSVLLLNYFSECKVKIQSIFKGIFKVQLNCNTFKISFLQKNGTPQYKTLFLNKNAFFLIK